MRRNFRNIIKALKLYSISEFIKGGGGTFFPLIVSNVSNVNEARKKIKDG